MKLVMVDPSKSGKDKVRSNTFHHFKKIQGEENHERNQITFSSTGGVPIVFHKFAQDFSGGVIRKDVVEILSGNKQPKEKMDNQKQVLVKNGLHKKVTPEYSNIISENDNSLVIKLDPRYNPNLKSNRIKHQPLIRQHTDVNKNSNKNKNIFKFSDSEINQNPSNKNKVKKVSFVNNVGKLSDKTQHRIFISEGISTVSVEELPSMRSALVNTRAEKGDSDIARVYKDEKCKLSSGHAHKLVKSKVALHEFESTGSDKDGNPNLTGKFIADSKIKLNKFQLKPPIINGYSTFTFKVNLKDQK